MTSTVIKASDPLIVTEGSHFESPEGGQLVARDEKSDLFLATVTTTAGDTYYENEDARDGRIRQLTRDLSDKDPGWLLRLVRWARDEGNMRRVPMVVTQELIKARLDGKVDDHTPGKPGLSRVAANVACIRPDEPSKMLVHWEETYGKPFPKPLKRGLADACTRLYTERSALKWDTSALKYRFGDVLEICHPTPRDARQADLFEWLLNRRHGRKSEYFESLEMVNENEHSREHAKEDLPSERARLIVNPDVLARAGMTWENLSSMGPMDAAAWEAMIPHMGYMALLRNLRNFDNAGISVIATDAVKAKLVDPDEVARSRQFPFRFLSAYLNSNAHWHDSLDTALGLSLRNVPELPGKTLQLVDCSGSMFNYEIPTRAQKAGVFAAAVAQRAEECETWGFGTFGNQRRLNTSPPPLQVAASLPSLGGTHTARSLNAVWRARGPFDRVIILTDEQIGSGGDPGQTVPRDVMLYTFNVAGYRGAQTRSSRTRHTFGGLTDQGFSAIPATEAGIKYDWPF